MAKGIAQEIQRLEEMLRDLKPRRTGPPSLRKDPKDMIGIGSRPKRTGPKIRRPVKTKPNAPGGSKPKRKRRLKKPKVNPLVGTTKGSSY